MKQLQIGLIGAGERGAHCYAPYALKYPHEMKFTCVAEPIESRRAEFAKVHNIEESMQFSSWEELIAAQPMLDAIIVATQDTQHYEPVMAALDAGYHLLTEKPMADTIEKTRKMVDKAKEKDRLLMVCHVLRYSPFFNALKAEIDRGIIGDIQNIHMIENIGNWHFAHSYVRGNWSRTDKSTPMIVAKCSHDMDILNYLTNKKCRKISSFGSLNYFKKDNAPKGATEKCSACPYNKSCNFTVYNYVNDRGTFTPFRQIVSREPDTKKFLEYIETTPYSRCVYMIDNNAVDHQTVQMEYDGGLIVAFTATAFSNDISRQIKIMGTKGELEGKLEADTFYHRDFGSSTEIRHNLYTPKTLHSGGDEKIMANLADALRNPSLAQSEVGAKLSLAGHEMAFAAERSRHAGGEVILL